LFAVWIRTLLFCLLIADAFAALQKPLVKVRRASREKASVHWLHDLNSNPVYWLIVLIKPSEMTEMKKACFFFVPGRTRQFNFPLTLMVGSDYRVSVAAISHVFLDTAVPSYLVYDEGSVKFRAGIFSPCSEKFRPRIICHTFAEL